jgi:hypothetical protein
MADEPDYLICVTCETPCYVFERDERTRRIVSAYCAVCATEEPREFRVPEADEIEE